MTQSKDKGKENELKCWCKKCGSLLKSKREYIQQDDTCDKCFFKSKAKTSEEISTKLTRGYYGDAKKLWLPADKSILIENVEKIDFKKLNKIHSRSSKEGGDILILIWKQELLDELQKLKSLGGEKIGK